MYDIQIFMAFYGHDLIGLLIALCIFSTFFFAVYNYVLEEERLNSSFDQQEKTNLACHTQSNT